MGPAKIIFLNPKCDIAVTAYDNLHGFPYYEPAFEEGAILCGYNGSTAEDHAKKYGYKFESLGKAPTPTETNSGACGDNVRWSFANGTLTISGTGAMEDFSSGNTPWYSYRSSIKKVVIENGVTSIGESAFKDCDALPSVTIPDSVTSVGDSAFGWCESLESVTIGNGVTYIGGYAFFYCRSMKDVTIPGNVTSIRIGAFGLCEALTSLTIENGVKSIGDFAFDNCTSLQSVTLPASVNDVCAGAFMGCADLKSMIIQNPSCDINDYYGAELGMPGTTVVYGYAGSTAQTYADKYGYQFESLGKAPQLAAPTVKIAKVAGGIKVTWNKISGSPRYMVYYKENGGGWKKIGTTTSTTYTRAAKYLKNGVTYAFTVRCCANDKKTLLGPYKASNSVKYTK